MDTDSIVRSPLDYVKLFSQRTSIRGIPKLENTNLTYIRWFWVIFVVCAHIIMIILAILLIGRYFRYDRTMKINTMKVGYKDFPEVTICSKRFFDMGIKENPNPFVFINEFSNYVYSNISNYLDNTDYPNAIQSIIYKYTTSSFFHEYFNFIQQRTQTLAKMLQNSCNITAMDGRYGNKSKVQPCQIKAVLNPLYLNCLAFSIPVNSFFIQSTKFKMDIEIPFAVTTDDLPIEYFIVDQFMADVMSDDGYQETRIYVHQVSDYPFNFDYEVPFICLNFNHFIVKKIQEQDYYIGGPSPTCRINDIITYVYGIPFIAITEDLCESLKIQNNIIEQCQCAISTYANNASDYSKFKLCNENDMLINCAQGVIENFQDDGISPCLPSCTKTNYDVQTKVRAFFTSSFSLEMYGIVNLENACSEDMSVCLNSIQCLLNNLFLSLSNLTCDYSFLSRKKRPSDYNLTSMSDSSSSNIDLEPSISCNLISARIDIRQKMIIQKESLVVEVNTLLSQMGGMCAFFTGLTFTFIAEVIETMIFWIYDHVNSKPSKK